MLFWRWRVVCYTEEQLAFDLRKGDSGTPVEEIIRKLGVSEATFYRWKKKSE